jgi:hypothetical protein
MLSRYIDGLRLDGQDLIAGTGKTVFSTASRPALGSTQADIQCVLGAQSGRGVKLRSPSSAEVKNGGAIPPRPHTCSWSGASLIKCGDNFLLTFMVNIPRICRWAALPRR